MPKTWFITGASRGFGREWSIAALERGDTVAATARNPESLADLVGQFGDKVLPLRLDVDDRDAVLAAVPKAHEHFGALRILLGDGPLAIATRDYEARLDTWREWEHVSVAAHGGRA